MTNGIKIICPGCNNTLELEGTYQDWVGQTIECPECKVYISIPKISDGSIPASIKPDSTPSTESPPSADICPSCGKVIPEGVNICHNCMYNKKIGRKVGEPPSQTGQYNKQQVKCPSCKKEMSPQAVICISCGFDLRTGEKIETDSGKPSLRVRPEPPNENMRQYLPRSVSSARFSSSSFSPERASAVSTDGCAVASLVLGIIGLFAVLPSIPAVICGHVAQSRIRKSDGARKGSGMAVAGLIMGYITVGVVAVLIVIATLGGLGDHFRQMLGGAVVELGDSQQDISQAMTENSADYLKSLASDIDSKEGVQRKATQKNEDRQGSVASASASSRSLPKKSGKPNNEYQNASSTRHYDKSGVFSYVPPIGWTGELADDGKYYYYLMDAGISFFATQTESDLYAMGKTYEKAFKDKGFDMWDKIDFQGNRQDVRGIRMRFMGDSKGIQTVFTVFIFSKGRNSIIGTGACRKDTWERYISDFDASAKSLQF